MIEPADPFEPPETPAVVATEHYAQVPDARATEDFLRPPRLPQRLRGREKKTTFQTTNRLLTRAAQKMLADDKALTEPRPQGSGWVVGFFSRPAPLRLGHRLMVGINARGAETLRKTRRRTRPSGAGWLCIPLQNSAFVPKVLESKLKKNLKSCLQPMAGFRSPTLPQNRPNLFNNFQ